MKKIITCIMACVFLSGCGIGARTRNIVDVTKPDTVILTKIAGQGAIHSITITGAGNIDGNAEISLILNGTPYKTETLSGRVNFQWGGDWYSDQAEIRYNPSSVVGGHLRLSYDFGD